MHKTRLEAFSDGVIAIIITIMVLELKIPHGNNLSAIAGLLPVFLSYVLSFIYVGIYWNNHHHLFLAVEKINGKAMWANMHLMFWLSLVPFGTDWMGENPLTRWPTVIYGLILLMNAIAFAMISNVLISAEGKSSKIAKAFGKDWKGKISILLYILAIALAFFNPKISLALYAAVAMMWFIPDKRIEHEVLEDNQS